MKISVIGAGNVGSLTAMRLAQASLGEVVLVDVAGSIARGKAADIADSAQSLRVSCILTGTADIGDTAGSDIVVVTAGLARKPGMTREELLIKNSGIVKGICEEIKRSSDGAVVIMVTNPLDIITNYARLITGFPGQRVMGMGVSLDASRFAGRISEALGVPVADIDPCVIGSHGQDMLPLARFTRVKGNALTECAEEATVRELIKRTVERGAEIVSYLGSGSAFFAPSAAAAALVRAVARDEGSVQGVCAYLDGQYGISGVNIGVPCRIGRRGIEQVVELDLNTEELEALQSSAEKVRRSVHGLVGGSRV